MSIIYVKYVTSAIFWTVKANLICCEYGSLKARKRFWYKLKSACGHYTNTV